MENQVTENLQTWVGSFLLKLGEKGAIWWLILGISCILLLIYLTVIKAISEGENSGEQKKSSILQTFFTSSTFFSISIAFTIFILRFPGLSRLELNPDESEWIAGALTLVVDPRFWLSVDGYTSGPLQLYPLTLIHFLGGTINYGTVKLAAVVIWMISTVCIYYSFLHFFRDVIARVIILPLVACVASLYFNDYVAYNSEHMPILLICLSLFLYSKLERATGTNRYVLVFICTFLLGSVPYAKLQAVPIAMVLAFFVLFSSGWKGAIYALAGGLTPTVVVLVYVLSSNIFDDFWQSYIITNFSYAKTGIGNGNMTMLDKYLLSQYHALLIIDTVFYFIFQIALIIVGAISLITLRKTVSAKEYKLVLLAILLTLASIYSVIQPGMGFFHYVLFTIAPFAFLSGTLGGILLNRYRWNKYALKNISPVIVLSSLIFVSATIPVSKDNPAFHEALNNTVVGKTKSNVARKVLEYVSPGERMAVWGWANNYHVETGISQGTRDVATFYQIVNTVQQPYYLKRYVDDLTRNRPAIFLEAVGPNQYYFSDSVGHSYKNFPELKNFIEAHYTPVDTVDGVKIFIRKQIALQFLKNKKAASAIMFNPSIRERVLPAEQENIAKSLDYFDETTDYVTLNGWAFLKDHLSESNITQIVLQNENHTFVSKVKQFPRTDVANAHKVNTVNCGFTATISKAELPAGKYSLAILIKNLSDNYEDVTFTGHIITK